MPMTVVVSPADELDFVVSNDGKQVFKETICSSYGEAAARVVTDKRRHVFVFLERAVGRGTNVSMESLQVFRLERSDLFEVLATPLSWPTGPERRFTYSYAVELPASGGVRLRLEGKNEGEPSPGADDPGPDPRPWTIELSR